MRLKLSVVTLALALAACQPFPEVSKAVDPAAVAAPFPSLLPAGALPTPSTVADPGPALTSQAAQLRRKAAEIRSAPVYSGG